LCQFIASHSLANREHLGLLIQSSQKAEIARLGSDPRSHSYSNAVWRSATGGK